MIHYSTGEGNQRRIIVKKREHEGKVLDQRSSENEQKSEKLHKEFENEPKMKNLDKFCVKNASKIVKTKKPKKIDENFDGLNDDEILDRIKNEESRCKFEKCKKPVMTLGIDCQFCNRKFCFEHGMPEVHGCGDAVRRKARSENLSGIQKPAVKMDQERKKMILKNKLDEKIKKCEEKRARKPNERDK